MNNEFKLHFLIREALRRILDAHRESVIPNGYIASPLREEYGANFRVRIF